MHVVGVRDAFRTWDFGVLSDRKSEDGERNADGILVNILDLSILSPAIASMASLVLKSSFIIHSFFESKNQNPPIQYLDMQGNRLKWLGERRAPSSSKRATCSIAPM